MVAQVLESRFWSEQLFRLVCYLDAVRSTACDGSGMEAEYGNFPRLTFEASHCGVSRCHVRPADDETASFLRLIVTIGVITDEQAVHSRIAQEVMAELELVDGKHSFVISSFRSP
jgi:hypothetical protein